MSGPRHDDGPGSVGGARAGTPAAQAGGSVDLDALLATAVRYQEAGCFDEAREAYRKFLQVRPDIAGIQHNLGVVNLLSERLEEARDAFRVALAIEPSVAD